MSRYAIILMFEGDPKFVSNEQGQTSLWETEEAAQEWIDSSDVAFAYGAGILDLVDGVFIDS